MKTLMMTVAAATGIALFGMTGTASAGNWGYGHNHGGYHNHGPRGGNWNRGYYSNNVYRPAPRPVYRNYGVPVYSPIVPVYGGAPYYGYGSSFGISTPNFGLFIR